MHYCFINQLHFLPNKKLNLDTQSIYSQDMKFNFPTLRK